MKRSIILGLTIASIACVQASTPVQPVKMKVSENSPKQQYGTVLKQKRLAEDMLVKSNRGTAIVRNETLAAPGARGLGAMKKAQGTAKNGYILYENFSGWDGKSKDWVPDGWTVDHRGTCKKDFSWQPVTPNMYYPAPIDGQNYFTVNFDTDQDEWLISPKFVPEEDMLLSYHIRLIPMYFYHTKNIDWIKKEYDGDKIQLYTFQILIKEGDGEWDVLRDYADEYRDYTYREIVAATKENLQKQTIALDNYVGKEVSIAFRYLGSDGDTMLLDAIGVGYPTLDNVWYMQPTNALYWGFCHNEDPSMNFTQMPIDIALFPANSAITWYNMSEEDDATYSWEYSDQTGIKALTSDDQYELTAEYAPEHPGLYPKTYEYPALNATAYHRADANYNSPVGYFQVGGAPYSPDDNYGQLDFTLFQFPMIHNDVGYLSVRHDKRGAWGVPVFGHNEFTNDYWLDYCLNGEEPMEGNYAHLTGIGNVFFAADDAPLVVRGMQVYGWGRIYKEAELTGTIYALDSEMHTDPSTFTVVARATISGDAVKTLYGEDAKDYLYIPFEFEEPVALQATEEHPAYIFMLEGFNSDAVDYFAPFQSWDPIETGFSAGYILSEINLQGHIENGAYKSFKSMQYMEDGEYKSWAGAFAIGLIAEYPWLSTEAEAIKIAPEETSVSVALNSYYDGNDLTVEAPEGLSASVKGRYDECVLTVSKTSEQPAAGNIDIKAPGLALSIPVESNGVNAVTAVGTDAGVAEVYDLSGRKVASADAAGVYIIKSTDGKVRKVTVK